MKTRKTMCIALLLTTLATGVFAQGNGMAGINEATKMVTSYFDPATKLIYAIGAVVGLIGGVKVYQKFFFGRPRYQQDRGLVVRRLHLSDCGGHDFKKLFPVSHVGD